LHTVLLFLFLSFSALISRFVVLHFCFSLCLQLERFLIENRDEYLRHSSKNYTAEQKQYNNRLTEELLEVAEQYHYVFDPEDFNFVAIRDRIRCYYKSFVQTARKRGLQVSDISPSKKQKIKKESKGTDTQVDIKAEERDDVGIDEEADDKQSDEKNEGDKKIEEEKADEKATAEDKKIDEKATAEDKKIDEKATAEDKIVDVKATAEDKKIDSKPAVEEKIDEKATAEDKKIDAKAAVEEKIDEKESVEKKIDEKAAVEKKIDEKESLEKDTSDKKAVGKGAAEALGTADAKEAHTAGAGKAA
jgi:hypothetical protein